jgi:hypothetical protein
VGSGGAPTRQKLLKVGRAARYDAGGSVSVPATEKETFIEFRERMEASRHIDVEDVKYPLAGKWVSVLPTAL